MALLCLSAKYLSFSQHICQGGILLAFVVAQAHAESAIGYLHSPDLPYASQQTGEAAHGKELFLQQCSFCHGKDAAGGDTGPDLTRSKLVRTDVNGNLIGPLVHNGRPDQGMPRFSLGDGDTAAIVAFLHEEAKESVNGNRRGVSADDLKTGHADAGRQYFEGEGGCVKCHTPTGDLAGVATRFAPLELELRMLYPKNSAKIVSVTTAKGEHVDGTLTYQDEFTIALRDMQGRVHSFRTDRVQFQVKAPVEAHIALLAKYTDSNIHDLLAYLQTLK